LVSGVLTITGTSLADNVYVTVGAGRKLNVLESGKLTGSFALGSVKKIVCSVGDGNDLVYIGAVGPIPSYIDGGKGNDGLTGGEGNDTVLGGAGDDNLTAGKGNDLVDGGDGNDGVAGDVGNDSLYGGAGVDLLVGGVGNDLMDGGLGADRFRGGGGVDTVTYASRVNPVFVDITAAPTEPPDDGEAGEKDFVEADVENVIGGAGNDRITGTFVAPGTSTDGILFSNRLVGGGGNDTITGLSGDDVLDGGLGTDQLIGGDGIDTADYAGRTDALIIKLDGIANDGKVGENDLIAADVENASGGNGNDKITGNGGANVLNGAGGNDSLDGGLGKDVLVGGAGVDTADYSTRTVALNVSLDNVANDGAAGEADNVRNDVENITGGSAADTLTGSAFSNVLIGNGGDDKLYGLGGNDSLTGGAGADQLFGGDGNDTLFAKDGVKDLLDGGLGTDTAQRDAVDPAVGVETFIV
jgi:Ca2+-binding RTX toxin-like protein